MNKSKGKFIAFWLLVVILAGFYLTMMYLGTRPQVGIEYRMYYITHELSDWPGYGNLAYTFGTVEYCTELKGRDGKEFTLGRVCRRKGQGFKEKQYDGSESIGEASFIYYIPTKSADSAQYECYINGFKGDGHVNVYANDIKIGEFDSTGEYRMNIGSVAGDELLTIKFVTDNCSFSLWTSSITE
ncbi:MAG: hypothetical protein Q4F11_04150 [Eubacteriales bacterium]|nr:hypothetical protein [Eubacteriales bacterium]